MPLKTTTFNVLGDGVTNDTAALQAMSDAAASGGSLYVGSGTYLIDKLGLYGGQTWCFERGAKIVWANSGNSGPAVGKAITLGSDVPTGTPCYSCLYAIQTSGRQNRIILDGLEFDGDGLNQPATASFAGVCTQNTDNLVLKNANIYNVGRNVVTASGHRGWTLLVADSRNTYLQNSKFENYGGGYDCVGVRGSGAIGLWIDNCDFGSAKYASLQAAFGCSQIFANNSRFVNSGSYATSHGFYTHACTDVHATNCLMWSKYGCAVNGFGDEGIDGIKATTEAQLQDYSRDDRHATRHCFTNCEMISESDQGCFWYNTRFVRGLISVIGGSITQRVGSATAIKLIGEIYTTNSPDVQLRGRRILFDGVDIAQETASDLANISNFRDVAVVNCHVRKTVASNHGWVLTGIDNFVINGGTSRGPGGDCRLLRCLKVSQDNLTVGCTNIKLQNHVILTDGSGNPTWSYAFDCNSGLDTTEHGLFTCDGCDLRGLGAGSNPWTHYCKPNLDLGPVRFANNIGYDGVASGVNAKRRGRSTHKGIVTLDPTASSVDITHYLAKFRPVTVADCQIGLASHPQSMRIMWVSGVDNSSDDPKITVCFDNPTAVSGVLLAYKISIEN